MGNTTDKMSGKAKEMAGKVTHNRTLEAKGKMQQGVADMKQKSKNILDE